MSTDTESTLTKERRFLLRTALTEFAIAVPLRHGLRPAAEYTARSGRDMDAIQLISEPDSVLFDENALDAIQAICPIFADRIDELGMTFFDRSLAEPVRYLCVFKQVHETLLKSFVPSQPAATSDEQPKPAATKELTMTNEKRRLVRTSLKGFSNPASLCKPMRLRMREETSEEEWNSTLELIDAPGSVVFSCKALDVIRTLSPAVADKIFNAGKIFADKYDALPRWLVCVSAANFASILQSMADVSEDQPNESFFDNFPAANGVEHAEALKTDAGQMSEFIRKMSPYESIAFSAGLAMNSPCPCGDEIRHLSLLLIHSTSCTNDRRLIAWAHNLEETLMKSLIELQRALKDDGVPY